MTKKEMFTRIAALNAADAEIVEFCNHEIALLEKKASGSSKPTKTQVENEGFKSAILGALEEASAPVTISELMEICPAIADLKNQRISALLTQLRKEHKVARSVVKKKAYFALGDEGEAVEG